MFRVKYLFGIIIGSFGLMYLVFAAFGMKINNAPTDKPVAYAMFVLHSAMSLVLFMSSYRDRRKEYFRLEEIFNVLKEINGGRVPKDEFAEIAKISLEDAQVFLRKKSPYRMSTYLVNEKGELIRPYDVENEDF
ncbi:MAG TPA: hypothetical protein VEC36_08090 [Patescibacteria group bacterium]|nr:hypothetical protein [Patescibacteria group bacterium]